MRASLRTAIASLACVVVVAGSGCSMFHHKKKDAPSGEAVTPATPADPALAIGAPATPESEAMRSATTLVTDFYELRLRLGRTGLPDETEMKAYRAFLCPPLAAAMDSARVRQRAFIDEHPDDKPPLVEGDLFSSLFEGVEVATPMGTEVTGDSARVNMSMRFGEGDQAVRWKDAVVLGKDQGSWCIADVEYRGDWPFANKGTLSKTLAEPF
jgi:hypothetical protein